MDEPLTDSQVPSVVDQIVELSDAAILQGKWQPRDIERQVRVADRHVYVAQQRGDEVVFGEIDSVDAARAHTPVLGFILTAVHTLEEVDAELQVPAERHFSRADTPLGMVKTMVVRESHRGEGIGSRLGAKAMSETFFEDHEVDTAIAVAWVRPDTQSNIQLAEMYGEPIAEYDEYYGDSRDCPVCPEEDYCSCTYRIYQTDV